MSDSITAPSNTYRAITPSDSTDFVEGICRGVYVGGAGDIVAIDESGTAVTFVGTLAGTILPIKARRVNATNTTASDLIALY